ncbi:MAG: hypothetical protein GY750_08900 [Lentisphaerae bacterium]|nr:hypothetical protein [Lentisphaerota bacterium]MCP4101528.1 hypothetical protein [Lentisphaerota bacterium]
MKKATLLLTILLGISAITGIKAAQTESTSSSALPQRIFAPYVDVCAWPIYNLTDIFEKTGQKYYTLAFIVADNSSPTSEEPCFGGYAAYSVTGHHYMDQIKYIRSKGGDVIVSFGGAINTPIAARITNLDRLVAAYQKVIDTYSLKWIDFDIEAGWVSDQVSIDHRNKAAKILQDNNPDLQIAYCLPVMPSGLLDNAVSILANAVQNGVRIDCVNIMTMDYGKGGNMGQNAINAMNALFSQLQGIYQEAGINKTAAEIWGMIGATPMTATNDTGEFFSTDDAQNVLSFANQHNIKLLSMWSVNRENSKYEYTNIFKQFTQ